MYIGVVDVYRCCRCI